MKVELRSITIERNYDSKDVLQVVVDGGEPSHYYYGGEPEDNTRGRTYCWVESLLAKLLKDAGVEVVETTVEMTEDEAEEAGVW